jgi:hypothetical protein
MKTDQFYNPSYKSTLTCDLICITALQPLKTFEADDCLCYKTLNGGRGEKGEGIGGWGIVFR